MTTPDKDAIINVLRAFARELRGTLKIYRDSEVCNATAAPIADIADRAEKAADMMERNGIPEVWASIANSMCDEAKRVEQIANGSQDSTSYADSLKVTSWHLKDFVLKHMRQVATSEGLRFEE